MSFVYVGIKQPPGECKQDNRRGADDIKEFTKTLYVSVSSNVREAQPTNNDHCALADETQKSWKCHLFEKWNVNNCYAAVMKQRLC